MDAPAAICWWAPKPRARSPRAASRRPSTRQVDGIGDYWERAGAFGPFRRWREAAAEPCNSCDYLALCRGGCRVVSGHDGDATEPDPECPRVVDWRRDNLPHAANRRTLPVVT